MFEIEEVSRREVIEMQSKKTLTLAATAVAVPLLVGCGQNAQPSQASETASSASQSSTSSAAPAQGTQTTSVDTAAGTTADPAATSTANATPKPAESSAPQTLPEVKDPNAGTDAETSRISVDHPKFGKLEIVSYLTITSGGAAPSEGLPSYAVYQNGRPVGFVSSPEGTKEVNFSSGKALAGQTWEVAKDQPVDRFGNVYLSYDSGVTVLTPTDQGFDSHGTMPGVKDSQYPFSRAGLKIDGAGTPTVIQKVVDKDGTETGKTVTWSWDGNQFVQDK
ncbi:hypothetical protein [Kocuria varians]|uniref:hypothetical protein n=1 Tax=Kocuria varians TaxID=1272 RepID=UPI001F2602AC|nr:hypothetical protein [Kocuria varians]